jgi:hypothetical protein
MHRPVFNLPQREINVINKLRLKNLIKKIFCLWNTSIVSNRCA